ncbi:MAG: TlpA family protein disulfide reductase [Chloroflexia bacterium]|nr:TlpA family protein disulfide reductase [Chloroflexia bacterium]
MPAGTGPASRPVTLADTDADLEVHGRIGYGTRTPWFLGGLLVLVVVVIGFVGFLNGRDEEDSGIPEMAPDFELMLFDGSTFRLAEHRGQVVVLNFWASWCEPCREEMPALQQAADEAGDEVVFVGIGAKTDREDDARAFAEEFAITYPVGRDTEGGDRVNGAIQTNYGVFAFPSTYVINPEGRIDAVLITPIDEASDIQPYIDAARD